MNAPLLSVCLITYNHENYIRQAIEGVLMQKVDFDWELIIAEDCSTDKTREIVLEYKEKYPDFIKLILQEQNVGAAKNWMELITTPKSKYIAYFEGDDYWTDPLKLQKQVNFLEGNTDYVLCFHPVNILKMNGEIVDDFITKVPENYETIEELARFGNCIHSPSIVFRNIIKEFPFELVISPIGDYFLYMMLAEYGKLKYLQEKMAVYRLESGFYSKLEYSQKFKKWNKTLLLILSYSNNPTVKKNLIDKLCQSLNLNDESEKTKKQQITIKGKVFKFLKLFIPPIFFKIKIIIFNSK